MNSEFNLEIITPEREFFKGDVQSLIIQTIGGEMGILKNTLPMVTVLESGVMKILHNDKWSEAANSSGFVRIDSGKVTIMAEQCVWPHEVDEENAKEEILDMDFKARKAQSVREHKLAKAQLAIQLAKLRIKRHGEM